MREPREEMYFEAKPVVCIKKAKTPTDIESAVSRLLRGISTYHVETVRDAWRELQQAGDEAVPVVCAKLSSSAWSDKPLGPIVEYLGVLLALLNELHPQSFAEEIKRLRGCRLHKLHRLTVDLLARRVNDVPVQVLGQGIPLYISPDLEDQTTIVKCLEAWSQTRGIDLAKVTRIDVIERLSHLDYLGRYNILYSGIILNWPKTKVKGVRNWWLKISAEFTFYHEVGHHACGHIEGGQVKEQEVQADAYAAAMMRKSRPVTIYIARILLSSILLVRRIVKSRKPAKHQKTQ